LTLQDTSFDASRKVPTGLEITAAAVAAASLKAGQISRVPPFV
jgi:hypothetical protein